MVVIVKWVSRVELGWPASAAPTQLSAKGCKIHYEGSPVNNTTHAECVAEVKQIRKSHLTNRKENYSDVAYNLLVCKHGYVFEGRGRGKRTGANGNQSLNQAHYAVCALLGSSGDTEPTPEMIQGIRDAIAYLRQNGAGKEIRGHRDGYATACPGEPLYGLVKNGELEPVKAEPAPKPTPKPTPHYSPFPGTSFFRLGKKHPLVKAMGKRLVAEGYKGYKIGPGEEFTRADIRAYSWWQRKLGYKGAAADGYPGKSSWDRLRVPKS